MLSLSKDSLSGLLSAKVDRAKQFVGQLATKGYFVGEVTGYDIFRAGKRQHIVSLSYLLILGS